MGWMEMVNQRSLEILMVVKRLLLLFLTAGSRTRTRRQNLLRKPKRMMPSIPEKKKLKPLSQEEPHFQPEENDVTLWRYLKGESNHLPHGEPLKQDSGDDLQPKAKGVNTRSMKEENDDSHQVQMSGTNFPPHREVPESQRAAQADAVLTYEEVIDILDLTFHLSPSPLGYFSPRRGYRRVSKFCMGF